MRAVDANLLVRLLARDDAAQVNAAERFVEQGAWVSHLVLAEALWVLDAVYERTPAQLAKAIDLLLNHTNLTPQDADVVASALANFTARPALAFSDCLVWRSPAKPVTCRSARSTGAWPNSTARRPWRRFARAGDQAILDQGPVEPHARPCDDGPCRTGDHRPWLSWTTMPTSGWP